MKRLRKSFGALISFLLILVFSVAVVPLDFYHNHRAEEPVCRELAQTGTCPHKLHLSQKAKYCWACAAHFDRHYATLQCLADFTPSHYTRTFSDRKLNTYHTSLISTALRGPPAENS